MPTVDSVPADEPTDCRVTDDVVMPKRDAAVLITVFDVSSPVVAADGAAKWLSDTRRNMSPPVRLK